MGKDKTDTILLDNPNTKNDKKKFIEDKENSIKSTKSKGPPKFTLKVRSDLTAEVLEDENTNDSIGSANSKSNKTSTSASSAEVTENSSSTSNNNKSNVKSVKNDNKTVNENAEEENNTTEFRIASKNPTGFKLRIVPLEKLLENPPPPPTKPATPAKIINKDITPAEKSRRLPVRRSKPVSFIELSDSEEEEEDYSESKSSASDKKVNKKRGAPIKSNDTKKNSESEEEDSRRSSSKIKSSKKSTPSDSDVEERNESSIHSKKSTKNTSDSEESLKSKSKKSSVQEISSDSETSKQKVTKNKLSKSVSSESEEDTRKDSQKKNKAVDDDDLEKSKTYKKLENKTNPVAEKDQSLVVSLDSEEEEGEEKEKEEETEPKNQRNKKQCESEEDKAKNSKSIEKSKDEILEAKKPKQKNKPSAVSEEDLSNKSGLDSDKDETKKLDTKKKPVVEKDKQLRSTRSSRKLSSEKGKSSKESSDSEISKTKTPSSKRKRSENSSESEGEKKQTRQTRAKRSAPGKQVTKGSDLSSDAEKVIKQKPAPKSKSIQRIPPLPSSVRQFVVRVKRSKLSDFKDICKNKTKGKMNGRGLRSEKPSTSRRKQASSDEDSDFNFRRAAIAEHDYSGREVDDDEDNEDEEEDKASQKSSDSEIIPTRKRRVFRREKKESENSDSDFEPKQKEKKKKRRVRSNSTDDSDDEKKKSNRKDIRKIIKSDDLNLSTKEAAKQEQERRKRIEERQKLYNQIYEKPESIEVSELVLDFDTEDGSTLLEVDKGLMKKLKPHQVTGVKFMWDACFETIKDAQEKAGSGCILAHCMGLGKTMQVVTLSHTLLANSRKTNVERVLIISPLSTLNNWAREFKHWIGFTKKKNIEIFDMSKYKDKQTRIFKLNEWFEEGGVCILGYDMYRILANEKAKGLKKKQREHLQKSLVDPGPDLVVCDEGHLLKNEKTSISKAVTRMRTQRRIVLTGTPLQNNLKEYYCMIQFIKPSLLGTYKEYLNRFVNPISNGQYTDSTDRDIRLMKHRSHILHKLLEGCIQRRDYSVLAPYLPPKHEYVVYTTLSILQQLLYEHYMVHQRDLSVNCSEGKGAKLFQDFQELRRIWTHPMNMRINSDSVIRKKILANESDSMDDFICDDDKDEDDAGDSSDSSDASSKSFASGGGSGAAPSKAVKTRNLRRKATEEGTEIESDIEEAAPPSQDDPSEWWKRFVADKELNNINHSPKLVILMRLLEQCEAIGDKLLVFSQSLQSLDTIEHFLALIDNKTRGYEYDGDLGDLKGLWKPGTDYFRLDGSCSVEQRESMCKQFNDSSNLRARLFLISTRAGGLGINLVSANRVVIFDVSWNPSHDTQSIFRVYRFGQVKPCYIYRLIAMGTMEQKLYERQVAKQATAKRVIDEQQISRHYNQSDLQELYTYELQSGVPREIPILPKDRLFAELLSEHESLLFKYHEHDSLLENEESENLSAEERKAAWSEYEAEKTRAVQTAQYVAYDRSAYGQFGNSSGSVTSNKIFGFRSDVLLQLLNMKIAKDHPEMSQNQVIQVVPTYLNELYSQMNSGDPTMYKDLLNLHGTLTHPSGMYMNPLLYVNQNPSAAGYFQAGAAPPANGMGVVPAPMIGAPVMVPGGVPIMGAVPIAAPQPPPVAAPGFDPNEVYEID